MTISPPSFPLDIALVGITGYAAVYLNLIRGSSAGRVRLRAVTAINRAEHPELCAQLESEGVEVFTDFRAMLDRWKNRLDLCILPVPIHLHVSMALQAHAAGCAVLLEKPLAGSLEQAHALCAAVDTGARIAIGFQDLYRPSTRTLAAELRQGRIGNITGIEVQTLWPRKQSYYHRNNWAGALEINGVSVRDSPVNNACAHYVNLALYFSGRTPNEMGRAASLRAELYRCRKIESFDTAVLQFETRTGIPVQIAVSHSVETNEKARVHVRGEMGSLTWIQGEQVIWEVRGQTQTRQLGSVAAAVEAMWRSVCRSLIDGTEFICTPRHARAHIEVVEQIHLHHSIRQIPASLCEEKNSDGDSQIYVPGLAEDLKECLRRQALPSDLGFKWSRPG